MPMPPSPGRNPYEHPIGDSRAQVLNSIAVDLRKIPGVETVRFEESGTGVEDEVVADIDTSIFAEGVIDAADPTVTVNWWPVSEPERYWYQFHYYDTSGFDCGWHRQENDHVDELDHYQERESSDDQYEYHAFYPEYSNPIGLLWEIVDGYLIARLKMRYEND